MSSVTLSNTRPMARAVFLDRDGVLNCNVFYADTNAWESPRTAGLVQLTPGIASALRSLRAAGYLLIIVSNQPNAAKGKCSREALDQVHAQVIALLAREGVLFDAEFLCFHHPDHTGPCACRKPSPFFLLEAAASFGIDLKQSWMIGDRATDIACGRAAGVRTVRIQPGGETELPSPADLPTLTAFNVAQASTQLLALASPDISLIQR